jgi:enoyl-CoA hydratase
VSYANIKIEVDGALAVVFINRPDKLNALNNETISELIECVGDMSADDSVGAVILTGAGDKAFVAGADIGMLVDQGVMDGRSNAADGVFAQALPRSD